MGFKDLLGKVKDGAVKTVQTTSRYNSNTFYGNVDHNLKDGCFGHGSYINVEKAHALIYGSMIEDFTFTANDIIKYELNKNYKAEIGKGGNYYPAKRCIITFTNGKKAQVDILDDKYDDFAKRFEPQKEN